MARYLLLLEPDRAAQRGLGAAEIAERTARFVAWMAEAIRSGAVRAGAPLGERLVVVARRGGMATVAERASGRASFLLVEAEDERAAIALAVGCPGAEPGTIEVHAVEGEAVGEAAR